jgi:hypothetical protein
MTDSTHRDEIAAGASGTAGEPLSTRSRGVVRRLSPRDVPTYLEQVPATSGTPHLIVVERFSRSAAVTDRQAAEYVAAARAACVLEHPYVVRARAIVVRHDEIRIACDFVDGERLSQLGHPSAGGPSMLRLEIAVRVLLDALIGLSALHELHVENGQRVKLVHGEVTADNILVGADGISRLLRACRVRRSGGAPTACIATIAPEASSGEPDPRADVFSIGVLLWQMLSGTSVPNHAPWAAPLADVAACAMAAASGERFSTATAMATEVRRIAGRKLATAVQVMDFVQAVAGAKIAARRSQVQGRMPSLLSSREEEIPVDAQRTRCRRLPRSRPPSGPRLDAVLRSLPAGWLAGTISFRLGVPVASCERACTCRRQCRRGPPTRGFAVGPA